MREWLYLLPGIVLTTLLLAVAHWMFRRERKLPRLWAYRVGVACLWAGFALWRLLLLDWITPLGLLSIVIVGGQAVVGFYWVDDLLDRIEAAFKKASKADRMIDDA